MDLFNIPPEKASEIMDASINVKRYAFRNEEPGYIEEALVAGASFITLQLGYLTKMPAENVISNMIRSKKEDTRMVAFKTILYALSQTKLETRVDERPLSDDCQMLIDVMETPEMYKAMGIRADDAEFEATCIAYQFNEAIELVDAGEKIEAEVQISSYAMMSGMSS